MRKIDGASVAVVGGAGFLGSHLVNYLVEERGCQVTVLDNLCAGRRDFVHTKARFYHADITGSEDYLRKLLQFHQCRFVFNYTAYPYIPDSFERPLHVSNVNFAGAVKVINAAHEAGAEAILQVSSAEIYGDGCTSSDQGGSAYIAPGGDVYGTEKIHEETPINPHSTYGASKAAVDFYVQARWRENKVKAIALRQFNCVGERETHPYVIPEIISQLQQQTVWRLESKGGNLNHEKVGYVKLGNNSFRDFMYAGDAVRIAVELAEKGAYGEVYNLGSESGIKIYDLAKLIGKLMGFKEVIVEEAHERKRPWEIWHLQSDNSKIKSVTEDTTGAAGLIPLEEALKKTIAWYESNGRKWSWENPS